MSRQPRAQATRARLLDATVEALAECGYRGTSTQEVCRRAGVSRGTLLHHFPTRLELLVGSLDAILVDRVAAFVEARRGQAAVPPALLVRELWAQWRGPVYAAWLELAVAARTEPALRAPMREVMSRFDDEILAAFRQLVDTRELSDGFVAMLPTLTFALFNGLAVGRGYTPETDEEPAIALIENLARLLPAAGGVL
jgi:AcrR family transcriptional regulator